jgi:hypothetical protein
MKATKMVPAIPAERGAPAGGAEDPAADEGADDADDDVADEAEPAADHRRSQPPGDGADHEPQEKTFRGS